MMDNNKIYNDVFKKCFKVKDEELNATLTYNSSREWDSVGHMELISELEDVFDIMMETDDIIDFSSYTVGKKILAKYDINF
jgi:acyl carrier protein